MILAVIYDQMSNGARVQELGLGECQSYDMLSPEASPSASTHPNTPRNTSNSPYDHDNDRSIVVGSMVTSSAVSLVEEALRRCSAPSQRLRCACYGRDLRVDPAEDGVTNAVALLTQYMRAFVHQPTGSLVEPGKAASHTKSNAAQPLPQCEADEFAYTVNEHGRLVLPNGLQVYTHFTTAPEETVFLYEEIFVHKVYQAAVQGLRPGDLVVDVGANVGMFSIYASRTVQQIVRCDNDCNSHRSEPLRILAVEPMKANFELLVQNARHCVLDCTAYNCAIAASAVDTADGAPADDCNGTQLFGMVRVVRCRNGICSSEHIPCAATKVRVLAFCPWCISYFFHRLSCILSTCCAVVTGDALLSPDAGQLVQRRQCVLQPRSAGTRDEPRSAEQCLRHRGGRAVSCAVPVCPAERLLGPTGAECGRYC